MTTTDFMTLGSTARGTIEPHTSQQARLDEITERLRTDEFYISIDETIPRKCIDGRSPTEGFREFAPNAAGGTETLLVADELTTQRFRAASGSTADDFRQLLNFMQQAGMKSGGHTDGHATKETSGCGANDKLPAIMQFIADNGDLVRTTAEAIGVVVQHDAHEAIISRARQLVTENRYASGATMLKTLRENAGIVDDLVGAHNEVIAVINTKSNTTLDRNALKRAFGEDYQAFNVDAWSFTPAAELIAEDGAASKLVLAMVYYNIATAFVLGGPQLRVIVRT